MDVKHVLYCICTKVHDCTHLVGNTHYKFINEKLRYEHFPEGVINHKITCGTLNIYEV